MNYTVRAAVAADLPVILEMLPRLAAFPLPPERSPSHLWEGDAELLRRWSTGAVPQCLVYVAVGSDDVIVGATITQLRDEMLNHEPSAHLEVLVVGAATEGHGIGQRLLAATEQAVRDRGALSLTLHVFNRNLRARSIYERLGFSGELIRYIKHFAPSGNGDDSSLRPAGSEPGRVLALNGSLRAGSSNGALLDAAAQLAPRSLQLVRFDRLAQLPPFSPDLDGSDPAVTVALLRAEVARAEAVIISSPEYAHGVPGTLKNALDWLVSGVEIVGKPVLLLNASLVSVHASAALREILTTMAAVVLPDLRIAVPADVRHRGPAAITTRPELADALRRGLDTLDAAIASRS